MFISQIDKRLEEWATWLFYFQCSLDRQKSTFPRLSEPICKPVYGPRILWTGKIRCDLSKLHQRLSSELTTKQLKVLFAVYGITDSQLQQALSSLDYQRTKRTVLRLKTKARNITSSFMQSQT